MYNKPITQRVMAARSGKCSPMKQTDTTVLNEEIPDVVLESPDTIIPGGQETITTKEPGDLTGSIAEPGGEQMEEKKWLDFCGKNPCHKACHKQFGQCPEKEVTTTKQKPDEKKPGEKANLYMYDRGDAISSYQQRLKTRGMIQGDRKAGKIARKAYDSMSNKERAEALGMEEDSKEFKKIKNKKQFGRAIKAQESAKSFKAQQKLNETQRRANEQGITTGRTGMVKGNFVDPNVSGRKVSQADQTTQTQKDDFNKRTTAEKTASDNKKKNDQAVVTQVTEQANAEKREDQKNQKDGVAKMMYEKPSIMKMKGAFKMKGFGSKK